MEASACGGFFQGLMDDESLINQWMTNSHEDLSALLLPVAAATFSDYDLQHSLLYDYQQPPAKQLKTNSWDSCLIDPKPSPDTHNNSAAVAASFLYPANPPQFTIGTSRLDCTVWNSENNHILKSGHDHQGAKRKFRITSDAATTRSSGAQDHIVAERKRREKLNQRIIALSAVVPGLKKKDKASVLAEAIKYLKQLQERVKILEEQTKGNKTTQSAVVLRKAKLIIADDDANQKPFSGEMFIEGTPTEELLPEIEARVCERNVLIRIHCDKKKGVLEKTLSEIVKLRLTLVSSSVITFGSSALDITIAAQVNFRSRSKARSTLINIAHAHLLHTHRQFSSISLSIKLNNSTIGSAYILLYIYTDLFNFLRADGGGMLSDS
uniref:BHLH domain-containing protein n=1 Tax=Kalanchoe fedtschenkoi TaxID=63787 RepID=A0A7N0R8R9_KALFE